MKLFQGELNEVTHKGPALPSLLAAAAAVGGQIYTQK